MYVSRMYCYAVINTLYRRNSLQSLSPFKRIFQILRRVKACLPSSMSAAKG